MHYKKRVLQNHFFLQVTSKAIVDYLKKLLIDAYCSSGLNMNICVHSSHLHKTDLAFVKIKGECSEYSLLKSVKLSFHVEIGKVCLSCTINSL